MTEFPNGSSCDVPGISLPDPESCSQYYQCMDTGCVEHMQCGASMLFDENYFMCVAGDQVDCGSRPCEDGDHCSGHTTTMRPLDCTPPDQRIDCAQAGSGYWPDPYNCRRYWRCDSGHDSTPEHFICDIDSHTGKPMMFDLVYNGCNYEEYTNCGDRPKCDECNQNCREDCHHDFGKLTISFYIQS